MTFSLKAHQAFLLELEALVKMPIKFNETPALDELKDHLKQLWLDMLHESPDQVRSEGSMGFAFVNGEFNEPFNLAESQWDLDNLASWIDKSRLYFLNYSRHIIKMHIHYKDGKKTKHWPQTLRTNDIVIDKSNDGESLFLLHVTPMLLQEWLWKLMGKYFDEFLDKKTELFYIDADTEIGASHGELTRFLRFRIQYDPPVAHGHPITEKELPSGARVDRLIDLGFVIEKKQG
jgi:hypothetical protein